MWDAMMTKKRMMSLWAAFHRYTNANLKGYDPEFTRKLKEKHPGWFVKSIDENKKSLLAMPKGTPRPNCKTSKLGVALLTYTRPKNKSYDEEFTKDIKERHPQWFIKKSDENKKTLLGMPKGCPKPSYRTKIGVALKSYTTASKSGYDQIFDESIRKKFPQWFLSSAEQRKMILLSYPIGSERPQRNMRNRLVSYTTLGRPSFDPTFNKSIRDKQPQWFPDSQAKSKLEKKKLLLDIPEGTSRPAAGKTSLGNGLCAWTNKNSPYYDREFDVAIRKKHPQWFIKTAEENKKLLLSLPSGSPKPTAKLRHLMANYTCKTSRCYDSCFDVEIRDKQPQWFVKTSEEKKKVLLSFTKGASKPLWKTKLGSAFFEYTNKKKNSYDQEFTRKLKEKQPQWF